MCAGDFIEVLKASEQRGQNGRNLTQMERFRECVDVCGLQDLGHSGHPFNWNNRHDNEKNVQVRLDRAFGNTALFDCFCEISVKHIATEESYYMGFTD